MSGAPRGIRTPNRQIRRLVLSVHAVVPSAVDAAQVGGRIQARPPESCLVMAGGLPRGLPPVAAGGSGLQDNRTRRVSGHRDDDLALGPAAFDVGKGVGGLVEPIGPV